MLASTYWMRLALIIAVLQAIPLASQALPLSPAVHDAIEQQQKQRLEQAQQQRETWQNTASELPLPEAQRHPVSGGLHPANIRQRVREIARFFCAATHVYRKAASPFSPGWHG